MSALKVKLVRSLSGHNKIHRLTVAGMGLGKVGSTRVLPDNPATRGMINQVGYLIEWEQTDEAFVPFGRRAGK